MISTVIIKGQMRWKVFSGELNARVLIAFLKRLTHGQTRKIILKLDELLVQQSKPVKQWLADNAD
jgi:hypothetical protein